MRRFGRPRFELLRTRCGDLKPPALWAWLRCSVQPCAALEGWLALIWEPSSSNGLAASRGAAHCANSARVRLDRTVFLSVATVGAIWGPWVVKILYPLSLRLQAPYCRVLRGSRALGNRWNCLGDNPAGARGPGSPRRAVDRSCGSAHHNGAGSDACRSSGVVAGVLAAEAISSAVGCILAFRTSRISRCALDAYW